MECLSYLTFLFPFVGLYGSVKHKDAIYVLLITHDDLHKYNITRNKCSTVQIKSFKSEKPYLERYDLNLVSHNGRIIIFSGILPGHVGQKMR